MQGKTVISVVTPVYNEHLNIEKFYEEVTKYMSDLPYDYEIIFVDDGSTDATPLVLSRLTQQDLHVRALIWHEISVISWLLHAAWIMLRATPLLLWTEICSIRRRCYPI